MLQSALGSSFGLLNIVVLLHQSGFFFKYCLTGKHGPSSVIDVDLTDDGGAKPPLPCLPQDDEAKEQPTGLFSCDV